MKKNDPKRIEEIRKIAHRMWLEAGKPDGDKLVPYFHGLVPYFHGLVPLKELHWSAAETEYIYGPEYFRSW